MSRALNCRVSAIPVPWLQSAPNEFTDGLRSNGCRSSQSTRRYQQQPAGIYTKTIIITLNIVESAPNADPDLDASTELLGFRDDDCECKCNK
jgi:hypothetical protein